MGIQISGINDTISAGDGGLSISGQSIENANLVLSQNLSVTGIATLGTTVVGSAVTINSTGINVSGITTISNLRSTNANLTGVTTTSSIIVGTAVTINSTGINAPGIGITIANVNGGQLGGSRNMVINGSMVVNQRGFTGTAGTTASGAYTVDRFYLNHNIGGVVSAGQTSMNSTVGGNAYADGFQNALILRVTTADTVISAGEYFLVDQKIEGYNVQGMKKGTVNAQPVTLSFWVRSNITGTYIIELVDEASNRLVSQAYTINAANTWEKKALTFPPDTTGVLANDNSAAFTLRWWLAAGSTYSGGSSLQTTWGTTNNTRAVGITSSFLSTVENNMLITGVQLEVGPTATEFERRSYGQELALCQRYFYMHVSGASGKMISVASYFSSTQIEGVVPFPVTMRTTPTGFSATGTDYYLAYRAGGSDSFNSIEVPTETTTTCAKWFNSTQASGTGGNAALALTNNAAAYLGFTAEL